MRRQVASEVDACSPKGGGATGRGAAAPRAASPRSEEEDSAAGRESPRSSLHREASSLSPSRRRASLRHCHELHHDSVLRQQRNEGRVNDRRRVEEASMKQHVDTRRPFERKEFLQWYDSRLRRYSDAEKWRAVLHIEKERRRQERELAECSFAPVGSRAASPKSSRASCSRAGSPSASRRRDSRASFVTSASTDLPLSTFAAGAAAAARAQPDARLDEPSSGAPGDFEEDADAAAEAEELVAAQALQIEVMRRLDAQEQSGGKLADREASEERETVAEDARRRLESFLSSDQGRAHLADEVHRTMQRHPGMAEAAALRQARRELASASEAHAQSVAESRIKHRAQNISQQLQYERLKAARELIKLQKAFEALVDRLRSLPSDSAARLGLERFDDHLVDRMTKEAWYLEARRAAAKLLRAEASAAQQKSAS